MRGEIEKKLAGLKGKHQGSKVEGGREGHAGGTCEGEDVRNIYSPLQAVRASRNYVEAVGEEFNMSDC